MRGRAYKYPLLLLLITGCAVGRVSAYPCQAEGLAVGRARLHATCAPEKSFEAPVQQEPRFAIPIEVEGCQNYNYFHECIDDEGNVVPKEDPANPGNLIRADSKEGYVEISGGSPTTGFWSGVFDFLAIAVPLVIAKFGL